MKQVGRYELLRLIGTGGMAEVWLARQLGAFAGASKRVAVKLMAEHLAADAEFQRMFESEVRLSMLLSHSNVVQVFDAGREDGATFLVMEWVEGVDLSRLEDFARRTSTPVDVEVAVHIVAEILRGLAYAHRIQHEGQPAGIVHRDVSPHNVLVSVSGEVKLTDFGVARLAIDKATAHDVRGKLRYMAPEQAAGRSRSPVVDLYPVGAILHELLTGTRFRSEYDPAALRLAVLGGEVPAITREVPPEVDALRCRLLAPDPAQRFQSADEALAALERWPGARRRTEAVAALCRLALQGSPLGADARERTDRGDGRWAAIDGTATQTATAADFTQTPTHTTANTGPTTAPTMATRDTEARGNAGVAIAIVVGSLLAVAGISAIVVLSLGEGDAQRDGIVVSQAEQGDTPAPTPAGERELPTLGRHRDVHGAAKIEGRIPPVEDQGGLEQARDDEPIPGPPRGDTGDEDEESEGDAGNAEDRPAIVPSAEIDAALAKREPKARRCGSPPVAALHLDVTFVGGSGFAGIATLRNTTGLTEAQVDCIQEAFVGVMIPPFRGETHVHSYTIAYSPAGD